MKNVIIAIDGPSGTGKGTIASHIATSLGFNYLDSGIYYRAVAYIIINKHIPLKNVETIIQEAKNMSLNINIHNVILNGENITKAIRSYEVDNIVAEVSNLTDVRMLINDRIRNYCKNKNIVVDGRDIGTNVFPNANIKIYLDAAADARARRRYNQDIEMGLDTKFHDILENIKKRDYIDYNRQFGALKVANDAIVVDTTNLTISESIEKVKNIIEGELK